MSLTQEDLDQAAEAQGYKPREERDSILAKLVRQKEEQALAQQLATARADGRREGLEMAARIAEGDVYKERYRTWPFWEVDKFGSRGNRSTDDPLVKHCDQIAHAIRAMMEKEGS